MAKYKAYPEYKYSEIEWLGKIPSGWLLKKAKYIFQRVQRPLRDIDGVVTAFRDGQVTLRTNRRTDGFTNSVKEIGYQGVRRNDLVIHAMDGFAGAIGVSDSDGKCSPVCSVCIPWQNQPLNMRFYGYLVRQLAVTDFILSLAKGIRERSTEFRFSEFSGLMLPIPPIYEQDQIAKFLDHETAKIDNLIEKQQQLIELLKEKRQAVISHAVTKGLNPDVPMKDSGVEWLGDVPAHWTVTTVKNVCYLIDGDRGVNYPNESDYIDNGIPFFSSKNITDFELTTNNLSYISTAKFNSLGRGKLKHNDLIITVRGTIGHVAKFDRNIIGCDTGFINAQMMIMRPKKTLTQFILLVSESLYWKQQLNVSAYGSTVKQLSNEVIGNFKICLPPAEELIAIENYLDSLNKMYSKLIGNVLHQIELMQERRTALISAAVTGKIDVRDWVAPDTQNAEEPQEATA
ncbi:Restriction modification system DNA specificity domain protein [Klebsiella variicola]|uniref:restriction endonuclease subunit S n=1 Tax=Klebsiella variicola TaxID=244366 RepID=UPI0006721012|nr:restriction endonuclease subunit S [Klebsiella variicola]MCJ4876826.1 restriction endonuclease subunit S [Klebsiella variicola]CTQ21661.1 Restriction modification system DNA specificity domain protein [Klebsiella variicola]